MNDYQKLVINSLPVINGQQMVPLAQVQAMITTAVANVFSQLIQ